eukprot:Gregarina_sp_Poly_1__1469@NODE_1368_length_4281_cov_169_927860_g916_i0_p3_GENE_NODE_1368_length_4281_cov_169_927860_g916_i0NODE_1368_length_4281_cov_169_927860_g916_i0_p3_ORF_typecomplete_len104_score5_21_NODE_1368_length_4281_cov_169_927860_g916_i08861197
MSNPESNSLLTSIRESLLHAGVVASPMGRTPETVVSETDEVVPPSALTVRVSKVSRTNKDPKYEYPYRPLENRTITYRGYPVDGAQSLKKSNKWRIQIVRLNS